MRSAAVHVTREDCDGLARALFMMGRLARFMPPSWDGAGISIPIVSPSGGTIGRALPGRGIYLCTDLRRVGITRRIPFVFERSGVAWLSDFLRDASFDKAEGAWRAAQRAHRAKLGQIGGLPTYIRDPERGAIATYDAIIAARGAGKGEDRTVTKTSITTVANAWSSLWRAGGMPVAGAYTNIPTGTAPNRTNNGAWSQALRSPTNPDKKYLLSFGFTTSSIIQMLILHDLLIEAGNIAMSTTGNKTITTTALTRYTDGAGVLAYLVVTTALGTGTGAWSLNSYTDQAGNAAQAGQTCNSAASTIVERTLPNSSPFLGTYIPLAAGDYGLRAISTLNVATAHSAGVAAIEITYPLLWVPGVTANIWIEKATTLGITGLAEIAQTSGNVIGCLSGVVLATGTSSGTFVGNMVTCEG